MGVKSNNGKKLQWGNNGDISIIIELTEDSQRIFDLMMQRGLVGYTITTAKKVCELCQFDKKCDCCPFHGVFEMANAMKAKIENELLGNHQNAEEEK